MKAEPNIKSEVRTMTPERFFDFIDSFDSPEQALQVLHEYPAPRRQRKAVKLLRKLTRRYIYLTAHPEQIEIQARQLSSKR